MPLSDANFIQENSGVTASGTSHVVSLPSGTTAGNTVIIGIKTIGTGPGTPSGFTQAKLQNSVLAVLYKPEAAAGETSWTVTTVGTTTSAWYVAEVSNVDLVDVVDATAGATTASVGNGSTASTGTTSLNAGLYTASLAFFGFAKTVSSSSVSWSGYTNGFDEVADVSDSSTLATLAVARLFESGTTRTFESTATLATSAASTTAEAVMAVFRAADSPVVAPLAMLAGFEWGTHGGIASHTGPDNMLGTSAAQSSNGTFGTNYLIQAGSARNSSYGLRIVQSASTAYMRVGNLSAKSGVFGFNVRVVSATGTVVVAGVTDQATITTYAQVMYDATNSKFGVRCGTTGTTSWQSGTTATNTWVWIDFRTRINTASWQVDWRIETGANTYTDQTAATLGGQSTSGTMYVMTLGGNASQTMTADYDDAVMSKYFSAYPLGPHEIRLLTVDPAGTPTISGTTTNFGVFTANTTVGAWNATNARNAVDEVPPTISASADGATQTAVAASDYMEFPMQTYTLGSTEFINGVRMLAPMWSATSAAADIAIRGYDGTTETALATVSATAMGAPTAISTTAPVWRCAMWQSTNGWSQTELDAAALRVGFSTDATPDIGVQALYLEVAIGKTRTQKLFGDLASFEEDPTRLGVVSVTMTGPDGGDSSLYYETNTTPTTVPVPTDTTVTTQVNAPTQPDANYIAAYWPPEPYTG